MFSFFSRRPKSEPEKAAAPRAPGAGPAAADATAERQRAAARRTAEQIDKIESEMIQPMTVRSVAVVHGAGVRADVAVTVAPRREPAAGRAAASPVASVAASARPAGERAASSGPAQGLAPERRPSPALAPLAFKLPSESPAEQTGDGILIAESTLPPDLEEAAILFANGQSEAAAATLEAAIVRDDLPDRGRQGWLMLLDILQAADRRADFDARSIAYAARFETSPPAWRERTSAAAAERRGLSMMVVGFGDSIDTETSRPIEQARKGAQQNRPLVFDFSLVRHVQPDAAADVVRLLESFIRSRRAITVRGARQLHDAARGTVAPGRPDAAGAWLLALLALRLLGEQQAFEDLSIDYCVTFEVSPPSWEPVPPHVSVATAGAEPAGQPAEAVGAAADSGSASTAPGGRPAWPGAAAPGRALELCGELVGRIAAELGQLRVLAGERRDVVIDARALTRLDFVAAGELLNELIALKSAGKVVTIDEPSHVIEALLTVMGVREHARLRRRR